MLAPSGDVFWQTCFFGRDLFLFRALSCQVHMFLHMILRRHCYSHLDLSANPDDCDWIKRWKRLTASLFLPFFLQSLLTALRTLFHLVHCFYPWFPHFLWSLCFYPQLEPKIRQPGFSCYLKHGWHCCYSYCFISSSCILVDKMFFFNVFASCFSLLSPPKSYAHSYTRQENNSLAEKTFTVAIKSEISQYW